LITEATMFPAELEAEALAELWVAEAEAEVEVMGTPFWHKPRRPRGSSRTQLMM
jgi:hypothetical protein